MIAEIKISNHPLLTDIERKVRITGVTIIDDGDKGRRFLELHYKLIHTLDDELIPITYNKRWIVDNSYKACIRDENGERIPNPNWEPEYKKIIDLSQWGAEPQYDQNVIVNEIDQWENMPAFDYFKGRLLDEGSVDNVELLTFFTLENDIEKKFFDDYVK